MHEGAMPGSSSWARQSPDWHSFRILMGREFNANQELGVPRRDQ
jgi:hypothetical protein